MLEDKKQEQIAGIISDYFDGTMSESDIDILAMKIYENAFNNTKWQKLKEWLNKEMQKDRKNQKTGDLRFKYYAQAELTILNKMQELEGENE